MKKALITGFTGQDGSFLAQLLLSKEYLVYGMIRRVSHQDLDFVEEMGLKNVVLIEGDLSDDSSISRIIRDVKPDEVYNLGAQSHVGSSFIQPEVTVDVTGLGVLRLLEAIRLYSPDTKFYQASTSEMFGNITDNKLQDEDTKFQPTSPYAASKVFAHNIVDIYRKSYNVFACCGILMNHESERRSTQFVTRKITDYVGRYVNGLTADPLFLGNIFTRRDWGYAKDYVEAMYLMLQQETPDDYVIGTGSAYTVQDFCTNAFESAGISLIWRVDDNLYDYAIDSKTNNIIVSVDPKLYRPLDNYYLAANFDKAYKKLGWYPKTTFQELVNIMVDYDLRKYSSDYSKN